MIDKIHFIGASQRMCAMIQRMCAMMLCSVFLLVIAGCSSNEATGDHQTISAEARPPVRKIDREALLDFAPQEIQEAAQAVTTYDNVVGDHGGHVSITLDFSRTELRDDDLANLDFPDSVAVINLSETKITDAGVPHLVRARNLRTLDLRHTAVTDEGIDVLMQLDKLTYIELEGCAKVSRKKRLELVKFLSPRSEAHQHERRLRALNQAGQQ